MITLRTSWGALKDMIKNPKVFVPDLSFYALFSFVAFIFMTYLGSEFGGILKTLFIDRSIPEDISAVFEKIGILKSVFSLALFFTASFVVGSAVMAWKYKVIGHIMEHQKILLRTSWTEKKKFVWKVIFIRFYIYALWLLIIILAGLLVALNIWLSKHIHWIIPAGITTIILVAIGLIYKLSILFAIPYLFLKKKTAIESITGSIARFMKNKRFTFKVWLITFIVGIFFSLIYSFVKIYVQMLNTLPRGGFLFNVMPTVVLIVLFAISQVYKLWTEVYIFKAYTELD